MSAFKVFLGPQFPAFVLKTDSLRIQSECGKMRTDQERSGYGQFSCNDGVVIIATAHLNSTKFEFELNTELKSSCLLLDLWDAGLFQKIKAFKLRWYLQSFTRYSGLTLVFMWNSALWKKFSFCFSRGFFASINKMFSFCFSWVFLLVLTEYWFWRGMGTGLLFYGVWTLSWCFLISNFLKF